MIQGAKWTQWPSWSWNPSGLGGRQSCRARLKLTSLNTKYISCSLDRPLGRIVQTQVTKSLNLPAMKDMLVRLIGLPDCSEKETQLLKKKRKSSFRRPSHREKHLYQIVGMSILGLWGCGVEVGFLSRQPVSVWLAQEKMISWDCLLWIHRSNFFWTNWYFGNQSEEKEIGKILLIKSLEISPGNGLPAMHHRWWLAQLNSTKKR